MEVFLFGLLIVSVVTGLATEAVKVLFEEHDKTFYSNTVSGIVSVIVSALTGAGYLIFTDTALTVKTVFTIIALALMGWISAMVGYDKIIQAIEQIKTYGKDE